MLKKNKSNTSGIVNLFELSSVFFRSASNKGAFNALFTSIRFKTFETSAATKERNKIRS
jgi:hypothetical protein